MRRRSVYWIALALLALAAACGPAAPTAAPSSGEALPAAERPTETAAPTDTAAPTAAPQVSPTFEELDAPTQPPQGALAEAVHAAAPAGPDEYRFDSGDVVGSTGRPQLVEFFTTW